MPFDPPPSLQKPRHDFSQYDDSFQQLPEDADEAATKEHDELVEQCRERGDWSKLRIPGSPEPTLFEMRQLDGHVTRALMKMNADYDLWFRAALVSVANLKGATHVAKVVSVDLVPAKVADVAIPNMLDRLDFRIVNELGGVVMRRSVVIAPRR